jgi:hypothetical protein
VAEKWTLLVLVALEPGPRRFGALLRQVEGVSQKMLTQTLRALERDELVSRRLYNEMPLVWSTRSQSGAAAFCPWQPSSSAGQRSTSAVKTPA